MIGLIILLLAGSLDELQSEVTGTDTYRTELEQYITNHNISIALNQNGSLAGFAPDSEYSNGSIWFSLNDLRNLELNNKPMDLFGVSELETIVTKHIQKCETETEGITVPITRVFSNALFQGVC